MESNGKFRRFKNAVFDVLVNEKGIWGHILNVFFMILILLNVLLVILDTFTLPENIKKISTVFENISVVVFTVEYVLRIWTSDLIYPEIQKKSHARLKYAFSFLAIIDLLAILPFYIPFLIKVDLRVLRALRLIRLLRLFKLSRYTDALGSIAAVFKHKKDQLVSSCFVIIMLLIIASVLMYNVETKAQPLVFNNFFDALWWSIATITTVGYGDIYPVTIAGKALSTIIAFLGIGLVAVPTGIITAGFSELVSKNQPTEINSDYDGLSDEDKIAVNKFIDFLKHDEK